jgi:hypothetical protein
LGLWPFATPFVIFPPRRSTAVRSPLSPPRLF